MGISSEPVGRNPVFGHYLPHPPGQAPAGGRVVGGAPTGLAVVGLNVLSSVGAAVTAGQRIGLGSPSILCSQSQKRDIDETIDS